MTNETGIVPTEFKVLVKPELGETQKQYAAIGLHISEDAKERDQASATIGLIIAVSPLAFSYADEWKGAKPKAGDRVAYAKYAGMAITGKDGENYRLVNDKDISATLEF